MKNIDSHGASGDEVLQKLRRDLEERREHEKRHPSRSQLALTDGAKALLSSLGEQREAFLARAEKARHVAKPTTPNLSAIDELAQARLRELAGNKGKVLRPSSRVQLYSGLIPTLEPLEPVVTHLGVKPEDVYWHPYLDAVGNDDHLMVGGVLAAFGCPLGALTGSLVAYFPLEQEVSHQWWFRDDGSDSVIDHEEGLYRVNAIALAWGQYGTHAGGFLEDAGVKIEANWLNGYGGSPRQLLFERGGNFLTEQGSFVGSAEFQYLFDIREGWGPPSVAQMIVTTRAVRNGAHSVVNMHPGVGGAAILGCTIERVQ